MARLLFPREAQRLVIYSHGRNQPILSGAGVRFDIFEDQAATQLADIQAPGGVPIPGSRITAAADAMLPLFLGPEDGTAVLWARQVGSFMVEELNAESAAGFLVSATVIHGDDPDFQRPDGFVQVRWFGTVFPNNSIDFDEWVNTS